MTWRVGKEIHGVNFTMSGWIEWARPIAHNIYNGIGRRGKEADLEWKVFDNTWKTLDPG